MKKYAFTLAEVLITLGIIGVVAAMTLPSIVNRTRQKELETAFNKQYSVLQQAVLQVIREDELPLTPTDYGINNNAFMKSLARTYKVIRDCGSIKSSSGCVLQNTFTYYKTLNGKTITREYFDDGGFISADGTTFFVEQGNQAQATNFLVSIDVNGYTKKPNRMGYDFFMFQITKEGRVLPMGSDNTYWQNSRDQLCSSGSTSNLNGFTCAYFAVTDKDYFKNLH